MNSKQLPTLGDKSFESIKQTNEHGAEYWSARDLQLLLGYSQWRRFEQAIERAVTSCQQSGNKPNYHFAGAGKPITGGKGAVQVVEDYHLSRFACYLIAQNGDPRKPEIAQAQKYFAVQARRQELNDQAAADIERLELRKQTAEEFKALSGAAQDAGVQNKMFGVFHDAGYKGLYGGLGRDAIKRRKAVPEKDNLLDRMNATELAANQFRMTQTRDTTQWGQSHFTKSNHSDPYGSSTASASRGGECHGRHEAGVFGELRTAASERVVGAEAIKSRRCGCGSGGFSAKDVFAYSRKWIKC